MGGLKSACVSHALAVALVTYDHTHAQRATCVAADARRMRRKTAGTTHRLLRCSVRSSPLWKYRQKVFSCFHRDNKSRNKSYVFILLCITVHCTVQCNSSMHFSRVIDNKFEIKKLDANSHQWNPGHSDPSTPACIKILNDTKRRRTLIKLALANVRDRSIKFSDLEKITRKEVESRAY